MSETRTPLEGAKAILSAEAARAAGAPAPTPAATFAELAALVDALEGEALRYTRQIAALARRVAPDEPQRLRMLRREVLSTYGDPDLPAEPRLDRALELLAGEADLAHTTDQGVLALAGAILRRRWELFGAKQDLERSLAFYARGWQARGLADRGRTAIESAFTADLLARVEEEEAERVGLPVEPGTSTIGDGIAARRALARKIREAVEGGLSLRFGDDGDWELLATRVEACFGLGDCARGEALLRRMRDLPGVPEARREATVRRLTTVARLQDPHLESPEAFECSEPGLLLLHLLGGEAGAAVQAAHTGKVGLALSGGGFRASFFHIGVLARLAERDVLRHVEVLSCVSGGSVVGAHYYLELRHLLQTKPDSDIGRDDYVGIVQRLARDFLAGVQRNIRTRILAEPTTNLRMIFLSDYSRTLRVGDLFEREIYARVRDGHAGGPRWLTGLYVKPAGDDDFNLQRDNWRRRAKVPSLVLNATSLNTGHLWQFTASSMGEPPAGVDTEIDANERLRRFRYDETEPARSIRLGHAVAASACVPGLFEPIAMRGLYPGRTVRLVDGGVHDNQGVASLLEQNCDVALVSDASGQMDSVAEPCQGSVGVLLRSNDILMARVRSAQYLQLDTGRRSSRLRGLMFLHLKRGLDVENVNWVGSQDPPDAFGTGGPSPHPDLTPYGVRKDVQRRLAAVRTDLDSFSDAEAFALMVSGYRMASEADLGPLAEASPDDEDGGVDWDFLAVEPGMTRPDESDPAVRRLLDLLCASDARTFKVWRLSRRLQVLGGILAAAVVPLAAWALVAYRSNTILTITVATIGLTLATLLAQRVSVSPLMRTLRWRNTLARIGIGIGIGVVGWIVARVHIWVFDREFLRLGRVDVAAYRAARAQERERTTEETRETTAVPV